MRWRGSTHQDVSLQEQPRLNGDADAGLAVSLDVAVGAGGQRERELLRGVVAHSLPAARLPVVYWETSPTSTLGPPLDEVRGSLTPHLYPWPWSASIPASHSHGILTRCQTCKQVAWPGRSGEMADTL